ncbi:hypothetical protein ZIOFF_021750 [Zingiber officinale]|uniref:Ubiquitin thioesterase OTU n=1 Tax=Zingiber officinale TaxID=94328 RepID=A0A8J5HKH8_ZINOF|nr:hypothetical protein ZIOFF_021750 [Zingiber officinale]
MSFAGVGGSSSSSSQQSPKQQQHFWEWETSSCSHITAAAASNNNRSSFFPSAAAAVPFQHLNHYFPAPPLLPINPYFASPAPLAADYPINLIKSELDEKNYSEKVMLIYDGLHYDALAMSPYDGAPKEFDQTIFSVTSDRSIGPVENFALNLVKDVQK